MVFRHAPISRRGRVTQQRLNAGLPIAECVLLSAPIKAIQAGLDSCDKNPCEVYFSRRTVLLLDIQAVGYVANAILQGSYAGSVERARQNFQNKQKFNDDSASLALSEKSLDSKVSQLGIALLSKLPYRVA